MVTRLALTATKRRFAKSKARVRLTLVTPPSGGTPSSGSPSPPVSPTDGTPPSAPGTLTATARTAARVQLRWGASTDETAVAKYRLERCAGIGCTSFSSLAATTGTTYTDTSTIPVTSYSYRVRATDAVGNAGTYSNTATVTTPPVSLHVDASGRHLVDQSGAPFLMTGDAPQSLIGNLTESDAEFYFAKRRAQGFNTLWINLLCTTYTGCREDGKTWDGIAPFTTPGDLATPNEAYFSRVDRMIGLAAQYGFVVLLDPIETGGWLGTITANGVAKDRAYGQYLGTRYAKFTNIIWMSGNDFQDWHNETTDSYVMAVARGIRDTDPSALQTVELDYDQLASGSLDDGRWAPLIDINASYTYNPTYIQLLEDYNRSNFLPTFLVEGGYEGEKNPNVLFFGTPQHMRRQEYTSLLSGATGQVFGNRNIWPLLCPQREANGNCTGGWKDELGSGSAEQMAHVVSLFSSLPWYRLVPDQDHLVVTDGYGTFGDFDYATAAGTPNGKLAIAYLPSARTITVAYGRFSGPVTGRWYDPTNGGFMPIDHGKPHANSGTRSLTTPAGNAAGEDDWVLVLEAS